MSEWISMSDKIPPFGVWMLISMDVDIKASIETAILDVTYGLINPRLHRGGFRNAQHWMPLPEPPGDEMSDWISVKDRLPQEDVDVLAFCVSSNEQALPEYKNYCEVERLSNCFGEGKLNFRINALKYGTVTHWMPLPKPPIYSKEKKGINIFWIGDSRLR